MDADLPHTDLANHAFPAPSPLARTLDTPYLSGFEGKKTRKVADVSDNEARVSASQRLGDWCLGT
jgi:hypothetical protein